MNINNNFNYFNNNFINRNKIEIGGGDIAKLKAQLEEMLNPKQESSKPADINANPTQTQMDEQLKKMKITNILDRIARGKPVTKEERALAGKDACEKADFINHQRKHFARQLKNSRTKEEAKTFYLFELTGMAHGISKLSKKSPEDREMAVRFVRVMMEEWDKFFSSKDYISLDS